MGLILYLIGNFSGSNTGAGGHYYSLIEMSSQVKKVRSAHVVSLGQAVPVALSGLDDYTHISCSLINQYRGVRRIINLVSENGWAVTAIHAYDSNVAYIGMVLAKKLSAPLFLTKCGGPVPKYFFPNAPYLFVFHPADFDYFSSRRRGVVTLLPNRVSRPTYDSERAIKVFGEKRPGVLTFFRIGRIGKTYKETVLSAIRLVKCFNDNGIESELKVIGHLESKAVLEELKSAADGSVTFHTDFIETYKASELIGYCDVVVGTGRGVLEAMASGRIVFFPVLGSDYPCLLNKKTFEFGFAENFSQRVSLSADVQSVTSPDIFLPYFHSESLREALRSTSLELFGQYFDSVKGAVRLIEIYDDGARDAGKLSYWDMFVQRAYLFALGLINLFRKSI